MCYQYKRLADFREVLKLDRNYPLDLDPLPLARAMTHGFYHDLLGINPFKVDTISYDFDKEKRTTITQYEADTPDFGRLVVVERAKRLRDRIIFRILVFKPLE